MIFTVEFMNKVLRTYEETLPQKNITPGFEGMYMRDAKIVLEVLRICEELAGQVQAPQEPS
ncbi:MAG: hypothetical protein IJA67_10710 [Oscillospiraceae bacterium]|nr:hypothetical protein [Oscillospiraceae bacterium]